MMKKLLLILFSFASLASAMQQQERLPQPYTDANRYQYRDETGVEDKRRIAVLAYGSLVNQPENMRTHARLEATQFQPSTITLPVSLMRESAAGTPDRRITAVIDQNGEPKRVWFATSKFQHLPNARNNLAAREDTKLTPGSGYNLTNIGYMKKILPNRVKDDNEQVIPNTNRWVIRKAPDERQQLPTTVAQAVAQWADNNNYTAVIWASFPPNISSKIEVIRRLIADEILLRNTQDYVRNLPDGAQTPFERVILSGGAMLEEANRRYQPAQPMAAQAAQPAAQPSQVSAQPVAPQDRERHEQNFTFFQRGDLPILLSAPHGGTERTGVPARVGGINPLTRQPVNLFVTVWDDGTRELAQMVSDEIYRITGKRPYLVNANFTRKEIDANRPRQDAYENAAAAPIYNQYHDTLQQYVNEIRNRFGTNAILVDIHGQGVDANTIYRGTNFTPNVDNPPRTVAHLLNRHGEVALTGPHSILGNLGNAGYTIYPKNNEPRTRERGIFSGGYIVRHYGSNNANGIDAIQLENGWALRNREHRENRARFARDLAMAIVDFYNHYLR